MFDETKNCAKPVARLLGPALLLLIELRSTLQTLFRESKYNSPCSVVQNFKEKQTKTVNSNILACTIVFCSSMLVSSSLQAQSGKIQAQQLVNSTVKKNADVAALEVSATPPGKTTCVTIAATEAKELGEKCDEDEFGALKTGMPHVEKEPDGYDVTAPLHDANGNLVGIVGIDFKLESGQTDASILQRTSDLLKQLGRQIPSKGFLFYPVP
jgi:hypothetical protein